MEWEKSGNMGIGGKWIDLKTARTKAGGVNWWNHENREGKTVPVQQHDPKGPPDKPVWYFENGDMYLGEWLTEPTSHRKENGFGITYTHYPKCWKGLIYIGEFMDGLAHGKGETNWLRNSPSWSSNELLEYDDPQIVDGQGRSLPFKYFGVRINDVENDDRAIVELKDGTARIGKWKDGKPLETGGRNTRIQTLLLA